MSFAAEATETLRAAAMAEYDPLRSAVGRAAKAVTKVREQTDIVLLMAAVADLTFAIESVAQTAERLQKSASAALATAMDTTGCTAFAMEHHTISLRQNAASVEILDPSAVPEEYMTKPAPQPDKAKIRAALKANGTAINWAVLRPGGIGLQRKANV